MLTPDDARSIAEIKVTQACVMVTGGCIIIDEWTVEKEYAWIFFYLSKTYWETKDPNYMIGGNAPIFVSKKNGQTHSYGTGLSFEKMIDEYEEEFKCWDLLLKTEANNAAQFRIIKEVLGWSLQDLTLFKQKGSNILDAGSKQRLMTIQTMLAERDIPTEIKLA